MFNSQTRFAHLLYWILTTNLNTIIVCKLLYFGSFLFRYERCPSAAMFPRGTICRTHRTCVRCRPIVRNTRGHSKKLFKPLCNSTYLAGTYGHDIINTWKWNALPVIVVICSYFQESFKNCRHFDVCCIVMRPSQGGWWHINSPSIWLSVCLSFRPVSPIISKRESRSTSNLVLNNSGPK